MKHALVPVEATYEMEKSAFEAIFDAKYTGAEAPMIGAAMDAMLAASPNGGKVSREQFNTVCEAISREFDTQAQARVALKALGLEVEE